MVSVVLGTSVHKVPIQPLQQMAQLGIFAKKATIVKKALQMEHLAQQALSVIEQASRMYRSACHALLECTAQVLDLQLQLVHAQQDISAVEGPLYQILLTRRMDLTALQATIVQQAQTSHFPVQLELTSQPRLLIVSRNALIAFRGISVDKQDSVESKDHVMLVSTVLEGLQLQDQMME